MLFLDYYHSMNQNRRGYIISMVLYVQQDTGKILPLWKRPDEGKFEGYNKGANVHS